MARQRDFRAAQVERAVLDVARRPGPSGLGGGRDQDPGGVGPGDLMEGRDELAPLAEEQQQNHDAQADAERVADQSLDVASRRADGEIVRHRLKVSRYGRTVDPVAS